MSAPRPAMPASEPSPDATERPELIDCSAAGELTRAFTGGELDPASTRRLRRHLARCRECMETYRGAVETTAALGRFTLEDREQRLLEQQRRALHAKAFGAREKPRQRRRWFRLRLVLLPAFFIYLMTQIVGLGPPPARVVLESQSGPVTIDNRTVSGRTDEPLVLPGRWINTGPGARARLDGRTCTVDVSPDTSLLLESARPVRFRLPRGRVQVEGDVILVTVLGLVEVIEGKGSVLFDETGLQIDPEAGGWKLFDSKGGIPLPLGRRSTFLP